MPQNDALIMQLAALDWASTPSEKIREQLSVSNSWIVSNRSNILYKQTYQELKDAFREEMLKLPDTAVLKKHLQQASTLAIKGLIRHLSNELLSPKDFAGIARLALIADGRFMGEEKSQEVVHEDTEKVAQELKGAFERLSKTVN